MWNWSRAVSDHAAGASFTGWRYPPHERNKMYGVDVTVPQRKPRFTRLWRRREKPLIFTKNATR